MNVRHLPLKPAWSTAIDEWIVSLRAAGQPETTCKTRRQHVTQFARSTTLEPWAVTHEDLVTYMGSHPRWKAETRYSVRLSLRGFYGWALHRGHVDRSPASDLPRVRRTPPRPHPVPEQHAAAALQSADERVALMIRLAGEHGLRRGEIALVHRRDVVEDLLGWSLIVHGKGGRERQVPLADDVARAILAADGYAFPGKVDGHISPWWVGQLVSRVLPAGWTTHSLRHRFATRTYKATHDLFALQDFLGHASPATTRRYVLVDDDAQRRMLAAAGIADNVVDLERRRRRASGESESPH